MTKVIPPRRAAFDPEQILAITVAYENTCAAVFGATATPEDRERIASEVISLAQSGIDDPSELYLLASEVVLDDGPLARIDLRDEWTAAYWSHELGVPRATLRRLVEHYGDSADAIRRALGKRRKDPQELVL